MTELTAEVGIQMVRTTRDKSMWEMYSNGYSVKDIAEYVGVTQSTVRHITKDIEAFCTIGTAEEYFAMMEDLYDILHNNGADAENRIGSTVRGLWAAGVTKRSKLRNMASAKLEEILLSKRMKCAGKEACNAIREYRIELRREKKEAK